MKKNKNIKVAIIGHGFVGNAMDYGFKKNIEKKIIDPLYNSNIDDLIEFNPQFCFICVPTPMKKNGDQDSRIIKKVVEESKEKIPNSILIIKSTVLPDVLIELQEMDNKLVYNPEFLRENHANEDFINSPMIILGGNSLELKQIKKLYENCSSCVEKKFIFCDLLTASLIKYTINSFLATKVAFFNEIFELYEKLEVNDDWSKIINAISLDKRIGSTHMQVPGPDGRRGFGGACFPKDIAAFYTYSSKMEAKLKIVKEVIASNNEIRKNYKDLNKREKDQNIIYM